MGWWKRMRNKLQRKTTGRPPRYYGHCHGHGDFVLPPADRPSFPPAPAPSPSPARFRLRGRGTGGGGGGRGRAADPSAAASERALAPAADGARYSTSSGLRPSLGDGMFEPMSFELPRRPGGGAGWDVK